MRPIGRWTRTAALAAVDFTGIPVGSVSSLISLAWVGLDDWVDGVAAASERWAAVGDNYLQVGAFENSLPERS